MTSKRGQVEIISGSSAGFTLVRMIFTAARNDLAPSRSNHRISDDSAMQPQ